MRALLKNYRTIMDYHTHRTHWADLPLTIGTVMIRVLKLVVPRSLAQLVKKTLA